MICLPPYPLLCFCCIYSVFCQNCHQALRFTSANCSISPNLGIVFELLETSKRNPANPQLNFTVDCNVIENENHCWADVFKHNAFRCNEFGAMLFWLLSSAQMDIRPPGQHSFSPYFPDIIWRIGSLHSYWSAGCNL